MKNIVKQIVVLSVTCAVLCMAGCGATEYAGDVKQKYNICKSARGYEFYPEDYTCFCDDNIACVNSYICDTKNHSCAECIDGAPRCENNSFSVCAYGHWMEIGSCDPEMPLDNCERKCLDEKYLKQCINDIYTKIECKGGCSQDHCEQAGCKSNECDGNILNACIDGITYPMLCPFGCTNGECNSKEPEGECTDNDQTCSSDKVQFICQKQSWMPVKTCDACDLQKAHCACKEDELSVLCDINSGTLLTSTCKNGTWITTTGKCKKGCNAQADACLDDEVEVECVNGVCDESVNNCTDGATKCNDKNNEVQKCVDGLWVRDHDCTQIDKAVKTSCENSGCIVIECEEGYSPDEAKKQCVLDSSAVCTDNGTKCSEEGDELLICDKGHWNTQEKCSDILDHTANAAHARCEQDRCIIDQCDDGYEVNEAQDGCEQKPDPCVSSEYQCEGYNTLKQYNTESESFEEVLQTEDPDSICKKCKSPVDACVTAIDDVCELLEDRDVWISDGKIRKYNNPIMMNGNISRCEERQDNTLLLLKDEIVFSMHIRTDKTCPDLGNIVDTVVDKELSDKIYLSKDSVFVCFDDISQDGDDSLGSFLFNFKRDASGEQITVSVEKCDKVCDETHTKCHASSDPEPTPGTECVKNVCKDEKFYKCEEGKLDDGKECKCTEDGCLNTCEGNESNNYKCIKGKPYQCIDGLWTDNIDGTKCKCKVEDSESKEKLDDICVLSDDPRNCAINGQYRLNTIEGSTVVEQCQNGKWEVEQLANFLENGEKCTAYLSYKPEWNTVNWCSGDCPPEMGGIIESICFVAPDGKGISFDNSCVKSSCMQGCNSNYTDCYMLEQPSCGADIYDMKLVLNKSFDEITESEPLNLGCDFGFCSKSNLMNCDSGSPSYIHRENDEIIPYLYLDMNAGPANLCIDIYDKNYKKMSFKFEQDGGYTANKGKGTLCSLGCDTDFYDCAK